MVKRGYSAGGSDNIEFMLANLEGQMWDRVRTSAAKPMIQPTEPRGCATCVWWGTDEEKFHDADERNCMWPKPFWMDEWKSHRQNILSRGCRGWHRLTETQTTDLDDEFDAVEP